jgi:hypothetical protein
MIIDLMAIQLMVHECRRGIEATLLTEKTNKNGQYDHVQSNKQLWLFPLMLSIQRFYEKSE